MKPCIPNHTDNSSNTTVEQVKKALSEHFSGAAVQLKGPISVRDNSEIFHALIDSAVPVEAAVKHCLVLRTTDPDERVATEQFVALERLSSALAGRNTRYRVPAPLLLIPSLGTFAMCWVDGESLTKKLRRVAVFRHDTEWFEDVGAWLGNFHRAGPVRRQVINLDERLTAVENLCLPMPDKSFSEAIVILQKTALTLAGVEAAISWLHGDCKTDNFILNGNNIYGIDISLSHENPVEYDLAQFLNNLDLLLSSPKFLHLKGRQSRLEKAFWRGYLSNGPTVSEAYLKWLRLSFAISLWHTIQLGQTQNIRNWILNRMFAKLTNRLSKTIAPLPQT